MKIMLVSTSAFHPNPDHYYPLSLGFLKSILEREGYIVLCCNLFNIDWSIACSVFVKEFRTFSPDIVGFNCMTQNRFSVYDAIVISKSINPKVKIVVGGYHASMLPHQFLDNFPVDFVVVGEGEVVLLDLLRNINAGFRIWNNDISVDLDTLPMPDHSYASDWIIRKKLAHMVTSRGCPGQCSFCATGVFWGVKVRMRSASLVVNEVEMLIKNYGIEELLFHDDVFNFSSQRCIEISEEVIRRKIKIRWKCVGRVYPVNHKMLSIMKESGCCLIMFGVESASDAVMYGMGKGVNKEQIRNCFNLCADVGIGATAFMMLGLPGETDETIEETRNFMMTLPMKEYPATGLTFVYPGTKLYERCKQKGLISDEYWLKNNDDFVYEEQASLSKLYEWGGRISGAAKLI